MYHLDVTFDDGGYDDATRHSYFNVTDSMIRKNHAEFTDVGANSTEQNYFNRLGLICDVYNNKALENIASLIKDCVKNKKTDVVLVFPTSELRSKFHKYLVTDQNIYDMIDEANKTSTHSANSSIRVVTSSSIFYFETIKLSYTK